MKKIILTTYRTILERIEKLEKSRKGNQTLNFEMNLKEVRQQKVILQKKAEECIDALMLSADVKEMAKNYYIKGMTWEVSFERSTLYKKLSEEEISDDKCVKTIAGRYKKRIERAMDEVM
ncbi:MAG: hypothetical protein E6551_11830 [Lachnospiraceae bacterium]|jgi:metal-dependent hydrolase (beta-lactamase superfamily II)|nr:hypothetical protein [Lachnospiraceae bacterium]